MVKGLDNWTTRCRIENHGIDPQIILEASLGRVFVQLGNFNLSQARDVARMILAKCDEAETLLVDPDQGADSAKVDNESTKHRGRIMYPFRYLTDKEREALSESERYAYDEACSNQ